ncbi:peptidylprolyl isomerase [Cellulosilyticum ruminicola]|uniref:peptidylprolyl isomerase n=1 Tax=Cellulosilyticum ruminicola TaxID=425254 RepID=UPI0006D199A8|nr:peptidylprolyl isomerase [Cellulosilyticum ruminicola]
MDKGKVLAIVDGREITESDFMELVQSIGQNAMQFQSPQGQKQLLDELVTQELLYSEAKELKLEEEEEYVEALAHMQATLLKQYAMRNLLNNVTVTPEEVKTYFMAHRDAFKKPETAKASHILVDTEDKAKEILAKIHGGLDFAEAAKKYSSCPSSAQGGSLGEFTRGRMVPEFDAAVFAMEVGQVSDPVKTQFGYHIIKLDDFSPEEPSKLEEIENQVTDQCLNAKRQDIYLAKKEELSKKYTVEMK